MNLKNLILGNITQDELLKYYNVTLSFEKIPYKNVRGLVDSYMGHYYIYINDNLSYYKRKKTLLHELAHIELNQLCQKNKDLFAFYIDKYEDEASEYLKNIEKEICDLEKK